MKYVKPLDLIAINFPSERKNVASQGVEHDVVHVDSPLNGTRLFRPLEITGDPVPVLLDLDVLDLRLAVPDFGRVNRPASLHVIGRLLGKCHSGEGEREKG